MTPDRFRACLAAIGWTVRELARQLAVPAATPQRWATGRYPVPDSVAHWLIALATAHKRLPPPKL